jgi:hypothetical protein
MSVAGGDRGPHGLSAAHTVHAQIPHQAIYGAKRHSEPSSPQVVDHLAAAVEPFRGALDRQQPVDDHGVGHRPGRDGVMSLFPGPIGPRSDLAAL